MILIEKIEIRYFRSFDDDKVIISDLKDLNIFSGANDSGKSNILRALNLFFNNEISPGIPFDINRDLSIHRENAIKDQDKPKRFVDITVHFKGAKTKLRDEKFSIKKRWNNDSKHSTTVYKDKNWQAEIYNLYREPNIIKKFAEDEKYKGQREKSINRILNSIFFFYVPAVKDEKFYAHLYSKLLTKIQLNEQTQRKGAQILPAIENLENLINKHTKELLNGIEELKTSFSIPLKLEDFYATFDLSTKDININADLNSISIRQRGDGLRAKSIPVLLELLEENEKSIQNPIFIWGFEEPENSYEYRNAQLLAEKFQKIYSKNKQIFITTHSFNFLSLKGKNISKYRIWKDNDYSSKIIHLPDNSGPEQLLLNLKITDKEKLEEELGLFYLNKDLEKLYKEKEKERQLLIQQKKELAEITEKSKYILLTEGKTDAQILRAAWTKLYPAIECPFLIEPRTGADTLKIDLEGKSQDKDFKKYVIGLFDNDAAGNAKYKGLQKDFFDEDDSKQFKKSKINKIFGLLLPVPIGREIYAPQKIANRSLEIEHYFSDNDLFKYFSRNTFKDSETYRKDVSGNLVQILEIPTKSKQAFADIVEQKNDEIDFNNFIILFDKVKELLKL